MGLAVLTGGHVFKLFKGGNEVTGGMELQVFPNVPDRHIGMGQQLAGQVDPLGKVVVRHSHAGF